MFQRFTDRARRVVVLAQQEAQGLGHNYIGTEHVLLGIVAEGEGVAARALESQGVELDAVREQVVAIIGRGEGSPSGHVPFTVRAKRVLELSLREALQLGHNYIGTEHILLGLVREREGVAGQVLARSGVDLDQLRDRVVELVGAEGPAAPAAAGTPVQSSRSVSAWAQASATPRARDQIVFRRFTVPARRVLLLAESEALRLGHSPVGVEHLLLGLLAEADGAGARALGSVGLDLDGVRAEAERRLGRRPLGAVAEPAYREDLVDAVERALHEALAAGSERIDTEHVLLGIVHQAENRGGLARQALRALDTTPEAVRAAVAGGAPPSEDASG